MLTTTSRSIFLRQLNRIFIANWIRKSWRATPQRQVFFPQLYRGLESNLLLFLNCLAWRRSGRAALRTTALSVNSSAGGIFPENVPKCPHALHCDQFVILTCSVGIRGDISYSILRLRWKVLNGWLARIWNSFCGSQRGWWCNAQVKLQTQEIKQPVQRKVTYLGVSF